MNASKEQGFAFVREADEDGRAGGGSEGGMIG